MSATEDRARAAIRAIASTVNDAPPLELSQPARGARTPAGGPRRRWPSWAAPLTAAAVIIAVAIALVLVKNLPGGGRAPGGAATATSGPAGSLPAGVPRYWVALKEIPAQRPAVPDGTQFGLVVADAGSGKTLATVAPPGDNTTFQSVSAAADDRTFAVLAVTTGPGFRANRGTLAASWYKLVITPGSAHPVRLTRMPVRPWSWTAATNALKPSSPGQIYAAALSESGQELAVADIPEVPAASKPQNWIEVKVFSVGTGQLLHHWTADDPNVKVAIGAIVATVPAGISCLTWIDQDRALAVTTTSASGQAGAVRRLNVTGPASGSLLADSTVLWSGPPAALYTGLSNSSLDNWPPQLTADGKSVMAVSVISAGAKPGRVDFGTLPLTAGTAASRKLTLVYRAVTPPMKEGEMGYFILWASPSGDTMIVCVASGGASNLPFPQSARFMVVSHGRATPLAVPRSLASSRWTGMAF